MSQSMKNMISLCRHNILQHICMTLNADGPTEDTITEGNASVRPGVYVRPYPGIAQGKHKVKTLQMNAERDYLHRIHQMRITGT